MTRWATALLLMHCNKDRRRDRPQLVAIMNSRDETKLHIEKLHYYYHILFVYCVGRIETVE